MSSEEQRTRRVWSAVTASEAVGLVKLLIGGIQRNSEVCKTHLADAYGERVSGPRDDASLVVSQTERRRGGQQRRQA